MSDTEQCPPEDIVSLWRTFSGLTREGRQEFLQSGSLYQLALTLFPKFRTASFAFLVAACEALKPEGDEFREHNAYDVIEALLGKDVADRLRSHPVRAQDVRSVHFHRGEFRADEFVPRYFLTSFDDPTFDEGLRHLARVASNAVIEWLKRAGAVVLQPARRAAYPQAKASRVRACSNCRRARDWLADRLADVAMITRHARHCDVTVT